LARRAARSAAQGWPRPNLQTPRRRSKRSSTTPLLRACLVSATRCPAWAPDDRDAGLRAAGALWGSLIGLLFMMPLVGDWDRCRFRRARRKARRSRHQRRVHSAGRENAAIRQRCAFLLIRNMTTDKVFAALRGVGDTVIAQLVRRNQRRNQRRSLTRGAGGHAGGRANRRLNSDRCRVFWLS